MITVIDSYYLAMGTDHHNHAEQPAQPETTASGGIHQPGTIIALGSSELKDKHGNTAMTFQFEAVVAGGSLSEHLRQAQATAIHDVLTYLAARNTESQTPRPE